MEENTIAPEVKADIAKSETVVEAGVKITSEIKELIQEIAAKSVEEKVKAEKAFYLTPNVETKAMNTAASEKAKTGQIFKFMLQGQYDAAKKLDASVDANGGYIVPEGFSKDVLNGTEDYNEIMRAATKVSMISNIQRLNEVTTQVTVRKGAENYPTVTASTPTFGEPVLTTEMYTGSVVLPEVLIEDTEISNLLGLLQDQFSEAFAYRLQDSLLNSSVSGSQGLFIVSGRTILTQSTSNTLGGFSNLSWNDLRRMQTALFQLDKVSTGVAGKVEASRGQFIMGMDAWAKLTTVTASDGHYIGGIMTSPQGVISYSAWGRPVIVVNEAPSPTTSGTGYITYTDLAKHLFIGMRRNSTVKVNTSGTAVDGTELNGTDSREMVFSARIAQVTALNKGIVTLNS